MTPSTLGNIVHIPWLLHLPLLSCCKFSASNEIVIDVCGGRCEVCLLPVAVTHVALVCERNRFATISQNGTAVADAIIWPAVV